jgi:hypothetical protein
VTCFLGHGVLAIAVLDRARHVLRVLDMSIYRRAKARCEGTAHECAAFDTGAKGSLAPAHRQLGIGLIFVLHGCGPLHVAVANVSSNHTQQI